MGLALKAATALGGQSGSANQYQTAEEATYDHLTYPRLGKLGATCAFKLSSIEQPLRTRWDKSSLRIKDARSSLLDRKKRSLVDLCL